MRPLIQAWDQTKTAKSHTEENQAGAGNRQYKTARFRSYVDSGTSHVWGGNLSNGFIIGFEITSVAGLGNYDAIERPTGGEEFQVSVLLAAIRV